MEYIRNDCKPPLLPLSFDRVNECLPVVSDSSLFNFPIEILGLILQNITQDSLPCLALVCRDCRQLARSRQFATVYLKYSDIGIELVAKLLSEGRERALNGGQTLLPSVGACIRQIFVRTAQKQDDIGNCRTVYSPKLTALEGINKAYFVVDDSGFYDDYILAVQELMSNHNILPHLSLLSWTEKVIIPPSVLSGLASSSIQHLTLDRVFVQENVTVELPSVLASRGWPLRTLIVGHYRKRDSMMEGTASQLWTSMLHLCSATLESLTWRPGRLPGSLQSRCCSETDIPETLHFPRLRYLRLGNLDLRDSSLLRALVSGSLHALELELDFDSMVQQFFQKCGSIPSLDTLVWYTYPVKETYLLDFLRVNSQLSKLDVPFPHKEIFLEKQLLPLLASSFPGLTSLSLSWDQNYISLSALETISTLHTLKQICLYVGGDEVSRSDWLNHHRSMQPFLGKLTCLRILVFGGCCCDYSSECSSPSLSSASSVTSISGSVDEDINLPERDDYIVLPERDRDNLDKLRREQILSLADEYVSILPELDWLYMGFLQMHVVRDPNPELHSARVAFQTTQIDFHAGEQWSLIRKTFGWNRDV
ncbi:hypothetical protein MMC18_008362 [Xylographa bjoerkii]|nr:hypothetical protein [Xylographa bjoerkii]